VGGRLRIALLALTTAAAGWSAPALAQSESFAKVERLHLDDVYAGPDGRREVELYVRALTRYREPVENLRPVDFVIRDGDEKIDDDDKRVTTLGEAGRGMTCVLAIDVSRTMAGEPFKRAKAAALEFMELLESRDHVAVVAFSDEVRVVAPFTASRAEARVQLDSLQIDSDSLSTVLYDGVHKAVELIRLGEDLPRRSFVIAFSDGKDAGSHRSLEQVIEFAKATEVRPPALVFSIGYARFGGEGLEVLRRLSEQTGGSYIPATSTIHLSGFFNEIWRQMTRSYVIVYPGDMDGESHRVEVEVEGQTDSRTVPYPYIPGPRWPYVLVLAAVALVAVAAVLVARGRSAGRLVFVGGPRAGEAVLVKGAKIRIGALPDNEIVIPSRTVSRYHAAIYRKGRQVEIEDLNSSNGTFVNGTSVRTCPLKPGDKIRIADVDLVFER
jgi:VWFA-related protein